MSNPRHRAGRRGEWLAVCYLRLCGYRIVLRNRKVAGVEVDILARKGSTLVVVEVKTRREPLPADGLWELVPPRQQGRLLRVARSLMAQGPVRVDVILIRHRGWWWSLRHGRGVMEDA